MMRIRSKRQCSLGFESLEGRLALSAGVGMAVASHNAHVVPMSQTQKTIPASFKGHSQLLGGSELVTTNLRGTIGRDRFTGSGTATVSGKLFEGGAVHLSNSHGSIQLSLSPAVVTKLGGHAKPNVTIVVAAATGKYAPDVGMTGTLNTWNVPAKPSGTSSFSGFFKA
jgi:hypothetical protein